MSRGHRTPPMIIHVKSNAVKTCLFGHVLCRVTNTQFVVGVATQSVCRNCLMFIGSLDFGKRVRVGGRWCSSVRAYVYTHTYARSIRSLQEVVVVVAASVKPLIKLYDNEFET